MKIAVLDVVASLGGMRVLVGFYNFARETNHDWVFYVSTPELKERENIKIVRCDAAGKSWAKRLVFECFGMKKAVLRERPDVVFSLQNTTIFRYRDPQVLFTQTSIPFQSFKKFSFLKKDERILAIIQNVSGIFFRKSAKAADHVVVQTKWMKRAVLDRCKRPEDTVHVVQTEAAIPQELQSGALEAGAVSVRKFIYPATYFTYKNHKCLFEAARMLAKRGISDFEIVVTLDESVREISGAPEQVRFAGEIPYKKLINMYKDHILVFPSYMESLGLPLAESRAVGGVVLASKTEFAEELLEGYENARFFDPFSPDELCGLMESALSGQIEYKTPSPHVVGGEYGWAPIVRIIEAAAKNEKVKGK